MMKDFHQFRPMKWKSSSHKREGWNGVGQSWQRAWREVFEAMQIFANQLLQAEDFGACQQCSRCQGYARPHKHGVYFRWRGMKAERRKFVQRYICPLCRRTWSVIPSGMMPYCCIETGRLEELLDERLVVICHIKTLQG